MLYAIDTIQGVVLLTLGVSILPQFLYFEISFLIREENNKPQLYESVIVGIFLGFATVGFLYDAIVGEAVLAMSVSSRMIIAFFIITGLPVGVIYKLRKKSFFRLSKREKKRKIDEL